MYLQVRRESDKRKAGNFVIFMNITESRFSRFHHKKARVLLFIVQLIGLLTIKMLAYTVYYEITASCGVYFNASLLDLCLYVTFDL